MGYDISEDPYVDPHTGLLRNKIGARTKAQLNKAEAEITYIIIATLTTGSRVDALEFDSQLLCDIHKEIFGDIYKWAGKVRTHDISKDWAYFAHAPHIQPELDRLSKELRAETKLSGDDREAFVDRITYYYSEFNAIHPFREGNGRAIRTFLRLLAIKHCHDIEWAKMDPDRNIRASELAMSTSTDEMRAMLEPLITKLD